MSTGLPVIPAAGPGRSERDATMVGLLHRFTVEHRQVLWACCECWKCHTSAPQDREVCYSWLIDRYVQRFGRAFHQSVLSELADMGFLNRGDTVRGGARRYYTIPDPAKV